MFFFENCGSISYKQNLKAGLLQYYFDSPILPPFSGNCSSHEQSQLSWDKRCVFMLMHEVVICRQCREVGPWSRQKFLESKCLILRSVDNTRQLMGKKWHLFQVLTKVTESYKKVWYFYFCVRTELRETTIMLFLWKSRVAGTDHWFTRHVSFFHWYPNRKRKFLRRDFPPATFLEIILKCQLSWMLVLRDRLGTGYHVRCMLDQFITCTPRDEPPEKYWPRSVVVEITAQEALGSPNVR